MIEPNGIGDGYGFFVPLAGFLDCAIRRLRMGVSLDGRFPQVGPVFRDHRALVSLEAHHLEQGGSEDFLEPFVGALLLGLIGLAFSRFRVSR